MISQFAVANSLGLFMELEGEFYPYGITIQDEKTINPFYYYKGEEFPSSKELIIDLRRELSVYLQKGECIAVAVCYLASKKIDETEHDLLVLEIVFNDGSPAKEFWFIIEIDAVDNIFHVHERIDLDNL